MFERYIHHGEEVWVRSELKEKYRDMCLCFDCEKFFPGNREKNCKIANMLYSICLVNSLVIPVFECPNFIESISEDDDLDDSMAPTYEELASDKEQVFKKINKGKIK